MPVPVELVDAGYARYRKVRTGYTTPAGLPELRTRILDHYKLPHVKDAANVIITSGCQEAVFTTFMSIADPGDEIIFSDPCFNAYRNVAQLQGLTPVIVPQTKEFTLDVDAIVAAITPRTRAILLNSPSNPTGRIDSEEVLKDLVAKTEASGIWLVSDEVYREVYFGERPPPSVGTMTKRAIVLSGLSKTCSMTGFRLGWILAPNDLAGPMTRAHYTTVVCASVVSQYTALEVFEHQEWLGALRPAFARQRAAMLNALKAHLPLPYVPPEAGFFVFLDATRARLDSMELATRLLDEADVVTVPGSIFGAMGEGYLRLSYGGSESDITEGIRRVSRWFKERGLL